MAAAEKHDVVLPEGSLVVVSGANGFIASHVADQLLSRGYRVRGTVRSLARAGWLQSFFDGRHGANRFSLAEVPDMAAPHAFDEVVKGAAAFAHVATPVMISHDPNEGVPPVVEGTLNALRAAATQRSVTRVVLTSSSTAAASPVPDKVFAIDASTWNETAVHAAWAPPPYEGTQRKLDVYSASKTQGEQAAWKFMRDEQPAFVLNAVLPNCNMGPILDVEHQGYPSTTGWIRHLWQGFSREGGDDIKANPPQYYVNVQDNARVHVAALIYGDVSGERLFSFAHPFNWNDILAVLRRLYPDKQFIDDIPDLGHDLSQVANERAEELLKRLGLPGWASLEDSVKPITDTLA